MAPVSNIKPLDDMWQIWQDFIWKASKFLVNVLNELS